MKPPLGFRIADALAVYGGPEAVHDSCPTCLANAARRGLTLAGCYGLVPLPADERQTCEAAERAIQQADVSGRLSGMFRPTSPRWYGLWLDEPAAGERLTALVAVVRYLTIDNAASAQALADLGDGLAAAHDARLRVFARLYPAGRIDGPWWRLLPHCGVCSAPWPNSMVRGCPACGHAGAAAPDKKRHVRGERPYGSLEQLLGGAQAAELLARYAARFKPC
jgi:hypothetical protein